MNKDLKECKMFADEIEWDMIHEDAVTRFLEWGNNNFWDALRPPVTREGEYSIYFVIDNWGETPKVCLTKMNNYGSEVLCERTLPPDMAERFLEDIHHLKGMHEPNDEIKEWLKKQFDVK